MYGPYNQEITKLPFWVDLDQNTLKCNTFGIWDNKGCLYLAQKNPFFRSTFILKDFLSPFYKSAFMLTA